MWIILAGLVLNISFNFVRGDPKVPCHFIFGDSLFDVGNNNDLNTYAKANYPPYGIDFPGGVATGRFTNGLTTSDVLTKLLGFEELIPPFSNVSGAMILKGVNYASGSSGIRPETGSHLGDRIWLGKQVEQHESTIEELSSLVEGQDSEYLNKCLYSVNTGSNDYINNYFMPNLYPTSNVSTPDQFATQIVDEYRQLLEVLYSYGARRTAIFGLGMIGCIPAEVEQHNKKGQCIEEVNDAVKLFNNKLLNLIDYFNSMLSGANFTFIDVMGMQFTMNLVPGMKQAIPCCKIRRSDFQCIPSSKPCKLRMISTFFDGFHPTESLNVLTAKISFRSPLRTFVHPIDINTLIRI
ncbi:hypothetical protein RND81_08G003100 [Saponaria officinalis]|uniref:Uncharacterized protein n=1 Tax=Saponaria officinalis TaxID=3572 RepID=A0AAW1J1V8_SAPOF